MLAQGSAFLSLPSQGPSLRHLDRWGLDLRSSLYAGNHGDKGFIRSPAPPTLETSQSRVVNLGQLVVTRTSGPHGAPCMPCVLCVPRVPRTRRVPVGTARAHVPRGGGTRPAHCTCPGRGTPDVYSARARIPGGGKVLEELRIFSKPKKRNTEGRKLYFAVKSFLILSTRCIPGLQRREHLPQITHSSSAQAELLLRRQGNLPKCSLSPALHRSRSPPPQGEPSLHVEPPPPATLSQRPTPTRDPQELASLPAWGPDLPERCSLQVTGDGLCPGLSETLQPMRPPLPPTVRRARTPQSRR